ncbi:NACHT domain-containing protein [Saccharopolyspora antimicrobica]|uniref:NACHT domain-containing protein n=1 Tax=Saccharopolyspora antimicrobica TaxID=455193 RepID=UPI0011603768|nr:hypothetical protein [Saccharopolyspora antimicrobica]
MELRTFKQLRDHISHGGPEPDNPECKAAVNSLIQAISSQITSVLTDFEIRFTSEHPDVHRPSLNFSNDAIPLWPLFYADSDGNLCLFARWRPNKAPSYLWPNAGVHRQCPEDEATRNALHDFLTPPTSDNAALRYAQDINNDLAGFVERGEEPQLSESDDIVYTWRKATSEGTIQRRDHFRLGPNDERQWRSPAGWVTYQHYLRELANWKMVARRLSYSFHSIDKRLVDDERTRLGWSDSGSIHPVNATVNVTDLDREAPSTKNFSDLISNVDRDVDSNRGTPLVYFITGEAGIGKTRAMVDAAKKRAAEIADSPDKAPNKPLFLYVRSTGQVLDHLQTVINAAVNATQNLNDESVKALCRNGLMVLLIDGFDELLGGSGYADAVGSLAPWLEALGGRGVVVVSSRSSYYLNQYRSSLQKSISKNRPVDARHRIAEIQPWTQEEVTNFVRSYGIDKSEVFRLNEQDRELLHLPFFARAFVEMRLSGEVDDWQAESLPERLLSQYLRREESKLNSDGRHTALLDQQQLRQTFRNIAEIMAQSGEREIDPSDLEYAAEMVVGDLEGQERLRSRLTVLCGLSVDAHDGSSTPRRFTFQHELFYDQFLADAIAQYLPAQGQGHFARMLRESHWRPATVNALIRSGIDQLQEALESLQERDLLERDGNRSEIASSNLGALWAAMISNTKRFPHSVLHGATFEVLDLRDVDCQDGVLRDCVAEELMLPSSLHWDLTLDETQIGQLTLGRADLDLSTLRFANSINVKQMLLAGELAYRPGDIRNRLRERGVESIPADPRDSHNELAESTEHFLSKLEHGGENSIIIRESDSQPATGHKKWTQHYGPDHWKSFIKQLEQAELVSIEPMPASGSKKLRIRFQVTPKIIRENTTGDDRVHAFWEQIRA